MKSRSSSSESPTQLVEQLRALVTEAEQALEGDGNGRVGDALASLQERLHAARERVNVLCGEARQKVAAGAREADQTIRTHPYESLAIALGVGLLIGVVMRRPR